MEDLSKMAVNGPWASGQQAGILSSIAEAGASPGSAPADDGGDTEVTATADVPVGTPPSRTGGVFIPPPIIWKNIG
jgi:hypothetical protein